MASEPTNPPPETPRRTAAQALLDDLRAVARELSGLLRTRTAALVLFLLACALWAFWPILLEMVHKWRFDPRYQHGWIVPLFAAYLLWFRRSLLPAQDQSSRGRLWGLPVLAAGIALHLASAYFFLTWPEGIALLPILLGICLLLGGWRALRWAWPSIMFLGFMVPLPYTLEVSLGQSLQRIATIASTFSLQTLGLAAVSEGNIIHLEHGPINVVEACSGLGMMVTFFAISVGATFIVDRPLIDKAVMVLSAVPISLIANIARITITGVCHELVLSSYWYHWLHDGAGWLMMPLGLALLGLELVIVSRLLVEIPSDLPVVPIPLMAVSPTAPRPQKVRRR